MLRVQICCGMPAARCLTHRWDALMVTGGIYLRRNVPYLLDKRLYRRIYLFPREDLPSGRKPPVCSLQAACAIPPHPCGAKIAARLSPWNVNRIASFQILIFLAIKEFFFGYQFTGCTKTCSPGRIWTPTSRSRVCRATITQPGKVSSRFKRTFLSLSMNKFYKESKILSSCVSLGIGPGFLHRIRRMLKKDMLNSACIQEG